MFVGVEINVPLENGSLIWRRRHYVWRTQILTYARHSCLCNLFNWFLFSYTLFVTFDITTATLLIRHWSQHQVKGCLRCLNSTTADDVPLIEIEDGVGVTCPMFSWCWLWDRRHKLWRSCPWGAGDRHECDLQKWHHQHAANSLSLRRARVVFDLARSRFKLNSLPSLRVCR